MYAVRVLPIQRGPLQGDLTFFSRDAVPVGSVVSVPLRKRMVPGVVLACTDVREEKLDLKSSGFALRKIGRAEPKRVFTRSFIQAVLRVARYHVAPEGAVLAALTFAPLLKSGRTLEAPHPDDQPPITTRPEVLVLQAEPDERVSTYKNLVREAFARGNSLLCIAPSLVEVEELGRILGRGIEDQLCVLSSDLSATKLRAQWNHVVTSEKPLVIIGTPPALSLPLTRLDAVVVERESARAYKTRTHPQLDLRLAAEYMAGGIGARLILADFPVRVETRHRVESHRAEDLARPQLRPAGNTQVQILDVRTSDVTKKERRTFTPISPESVLHIKGVLARGGRVAVFAARRGIAPLTVCNDCGTPVTDPATGAPMVLHKTPKGNAFISHRSGAVVPANTKCATCNGWNLVTLGIGVDRVADELKKVLPGVPLTLFTQDTAATHREAKKLALDFYGTRGSVLVGTERMLPYLREPVECAVVASIDSMLSLSAWRAHEQALQILLYLRSRTEQTLIVETRKPESEVMKALQSGNPLDFYRTEAAERAEFEYPPFATFVGLAWSGTEAQCAETRKIVVDTLKGLDLVGPLPPEVVQRGHLQERAVIRVTPTKWPEQDILDRLATLPERVRVTVDPETLV